MSRKPTANGLFLWPNHECLLSRLSEHLLAKHAEQLQEVVVVLPTQRLATLLLAMLAKELGTFRPPKLFTLEQFIQHYGDSSTKHLKTISDLVEELVIAALLREKQYRHLALGHEHELKQFFHDLQEHGLAELGFERLQALMQEDTYRDPQHLENLSARMAEIADLQTRLKERLAMGALVNHPNKLTANALAIQAEVFKDAQLPMAWLYIACFTTVKANLRPFLAFLATKRNVSLWFSQPPQILAKLEPLRELIASVCPQHSQDDFHELKQQPSSLARKRQIRIHSSQSVLSEAALAIQIAEDYLQAGYHPSQIAILLSHEGSYAKLLRSMVRQCTLEANLAVSTALAQTSLGAWLMQLVGLLAKPAEDEGSLSLLLALSSHPITQAFLASQGLSYQARQELLQSFEYTIAKFAGSKIPPIESLLKGMPQDALRRALEGFFQPLAQLRQMGAPLAGRFKRFPMSQWCHCFDELLSAYGVWDANFGEDEGVAQSSVSALAELLDGLRDASACLDSHLAAQEFWDLLQSKLMILETRSIGYPLKGIQILSLIEARYMPFEVLIILGCIEGQCPKGMPKDHLVDDWFKGRIGLPAWTYVEALEDTTFALLKARVPKLELLYPSEVAGQSVVRSRFIEKILIGAPHMRVQRDHGEALAKILSPPGGRDCQRNGVSPIVLHHVKGLGLKRPGTFIKSCLQAALKA